MSASRARTGALLALGLIAALVWYFIATAPRQVGVAPTPMPSDVPPATKEQAPAPSASPSPGPTPTASPTLSPAAESRLDAVKNLRVESNTDRAVALTWTPVTGASRYAVLSYESLIGYAPGQRGVVLWSGQGSRMRVSVAAIGADGRQGPISSIEVLRPPPSDPAVPSPSAMPRPASPGSAGG